jgi:hypothetical protein
MAISEKEREWVESQKKSVDITFPEKKPNEEPATEKQINYIRHLSKGIELPDDLGKWQASFLIDKIKHTQDEFHDELAKMRISIEQKKGCLGVLIIIALPVSILYFLLNLS